MSTEQLRALAELLGLATVIITAAVAVARFPPARWIGRTIVAPTLRYLWRTIVAYPFTAVVAQPFARWFRSQIREEVAPIMADLSPNGGHGTRDVIDALGRMVDLLALEVQRLRKVVAEMDKKVAAMGHSVARSVDHALAARDGVHEISRDRHAESVERQARQGVLDSHLDRIEKRLEPIEKTVEEWRTSHPEMRPEEDR